MAADIEKVLSCFPNFKREKQNQWMAYCPCHDDKNRSLAIALKNGKLLLFDHGGCETEHILEEVGLNWSDLGSESNKPNYTVFDRILYGKRQKYGESTTLNGIYPYTDENGKYLFHKLRFENGNFDGGDKKLIRYYRIDFAADTFENGISDDTQKTLYRLPKLLKAIKEGYPVYYVEGEKDVETLEKFGWTATTAGSAKDWRTEYAKYFKGADVRILPDNDEVGMKLAEKIKEDLSDFAYRSRIVKTSEAEKGDVTDYLSEEGHDKESLKELIDFTPIHHACWVNVKTDKDNKITGESTNADLLARIINSNEHFLIVRSYDEKDRLYMYKGGYYQKCNSSAIKGMIREYHLKGKATESGLTNTFKLLLYGSESEHIKSVSELDCNEEIINLKNGIFNLATWKFEKHSPEYITTVQLNVCYDDNARQFPVFEKYMKELCVDEEGNPDNEKIMVLQEVMGLILSNIKCYRTKKAVFLYSPKGNSGKTQYMNLLRYLLGDDKAANIALRTMTEENRFALSRIVGKRMISVGDQTSATIEDSSIFKQITGGDPVKVEPKGKEAFDFLFKGMMIFGCNDLPDFKDDKGEHLFDRLLIVPCIKVLSEEEKDPEILEKMKNESSAIFNWALLGLKRLRLNNYRFTESTAVNKCLNDYRETIDTVYAFMKEEGFAVTNDNDDRYSKLDFDDEYITWCEKNEIEHPVKKKNIKLRMEKRGCIYSKGNLPDGRRNVFIYKRLKRISKYITSNDQELHDEGFNPANLDTVPFKEHTEEADDWDIPDEEIG